MKKVSAMGRIGLTTSVIPHRNGKYPIWFENSDDVEFVDSKDVVFQDCKKTLKTKNQHEKKKTNPGND